MQHWLSFTTPSLSAPCSIRSAISQGCTHCSWDWGCIRNSEQKKATGEAKESVCLFNACPDYYMRECKWQTDFSIGRFCQPGWALAAPCAGWDGLREERGGKQNCPCEKTIFKEGRRTLQGDTKSGDAYRYRGSRFICSQQGAERDVATWDTDIAAWWEMTFPSSLSYIFIHHQIVHIFLLPAFFFFFLWDQIALLSS